METLQSFLKNFRDNKGWNQPKMAEFIGIGHRTYQEIEKTGVVKKVEDTEKIKLKTGWPDTQKYAYNIASENVPLSFLTVINGLVENGRILAEGNLRLVDNNTELTGMLKSELSKTTAADPVFENSEVFGVIWKGLVDVLIDLGLGQKEWKTREEGRAVLSRKLYGALAKEKKADIHADAGS